MVGCCGPEEVHFLMSRFERSTTPQDAASALTTAPAALVSIGPGVIPPAPATPPRVAVLVETHIGPGRDMIRGIARYVRESGPWALHLEPRIQLFADGWEPKWLSTWHGNGIIARFETNSVVAAARRAGVPAVDVLG